ncbi:MAG: DUF1631 family protein [Burkholderiaceae bacterium]
MFKDLTPDTDFTAPAAAAMPLTDSGREQVLARVRQLALEQLTSLVTEATSRIGDDLSEQASRTFQYAQQRALHDAAAAIDNGGARLPGSFRDAYGRLYAVRLQGDRPPANAAAATQPSPDELSLVDDVDMRDSLKLSRLVHRTRGKLDSDEVLGVRARLGELMDRDWFDETRHPLAPEAVFEALGEALDGLVEDDAPRQAILEALEPYVTTNLNEVYVAANTLMREAGVLPRIKPRVAITADTGRARQRPRPDKDLRDSTPGEHELVPEQLLTDRVVLPPPGPDRDAILTILARQLSEGGREARRSAATMLAEPANFVGEGVQMTAPDDQLIEALNNLQANGHRHNGGGLPSESMRGLAGPIQEAGNALDQLTVEIVSLIFDFLYNDPRIPESIKHQLLRLQVVAVKAALLDRSFFASRQHPMRRLIDRTTEISCDPDTNAAEESPFLIGVRGLIDEVLETFDRDLDVFEAATAKLEALEQAEAERRGAQLRAFTERAEKVETERIAHDEARRELKSRINDLTPEFVRAFLTDQWAHVCAADRLQGPPGEAALAEHLRFAEQLIWSVEPKKGPDIAEMAALLPSMVRGLMNGLDGADIEHDRTDAFFNELMKWHTRSITQARQAAASRSPVPALEPARRVPPPIPRHATPSQAPTDALEAAQPLPVPEADKSQQTVAVNPEEAMLDSLKRGQLIEVRQADKPSLRVKLAWVSPARTLFAISRFPDFARSLSRKEMLMSLSCGRLVLVEPEATVDRAIKAVQCNGEGFPETRFFNDPEGSLIEMDTGIHVPV